MVAKGVKRARAEEEEAVVEVAATRGSEDAPPAKQSRWTNKTRVLVIAARGISFRGRHLMEDIFRLMPHAKTDSKMQKKESLFALNEIAEMKNCSKVIDLSSNLLLLFSENCKYLTADMTVIVRSVC